MVNFVQSSQCYCRQHTEAVLGQGDMSPTFNDSSAVPVEKIAPHFCCVSAKNYFQNPVPHTCTLYEYYIIVAAKGNAITAE